MILYQLHKKSDTFRVIIFTSLPSTKSNYNNNQFYINPDKYLTDDHNIRVNLCVNMNKFKIYGSLRVGKILY